VSRRATLPLATVLVLALTGSSEAATLTGDQACYQESERVNVVGTGYTPNGVVNFSRDNAAFGTLQADASGTVRGFGVAPEISPSRQHRFSLEGRDATDPSIVATINPLATVFDVKVNPLGGKPNRRRTITARGFTEGKTLYIHIRRKGRGKNVRLGRLKRPCGTKKLRRRIFRRRTQNGVYRVQFDARRRYSSRTSPKATYRVTIFQTFASSLASGAAFGTQFERWEKE
jgi:hypothetical protein